jgi:predicted transcriptional regulator
MVQTTLKLPPELKKRIGPFAKRSGQTAHGWMVAALQRESDRLEQWNAFIEAGEAAALDAGAPFYRADDVHAYMRKKAQGKRAVGPKTQR